MTKNCQHNFDYHVSRLVAERYIASASLKQIILMHLTSHKVAKSNNFSNCEKMWVQQSTMLKGINSIQVFNFLLFLFKFTTINQKNVFKK